MKPEQALKPITKIGRIFPKDSFEGKLYTLDGDTKSSFDVSLNLVGGLNLDLKKFRALEPHEKRFILACLEKELSVEQPRSYLHLLRKYIREEIEKGTPDTGDVLNREERISDAVEKRVIDIGLDDRSLLFEIGFKRNIVEGEIESDRREQQATRERPQKIRGLQSLLEGLQIEEKRILEITSQVGLRGIQHEIKKIQAELVKENKKLAVDIDRAKSFI